MMAGRQLFNVLEDADWIGHIAERKISVEGPRIDRALHFRMIEQRFQLRTKNERTAAGDGVIQRFLADPIAGNEQLLITLVPTGEGKHAAQVMKTSRAIFFVSMNDCFRVGVGDEVMAARL